MSSTVQTASQHKHHIRRAGPLTTHCHYPLDEHGQCFAQETHPLLRNNSGMSIRSLAAVVLLTSSSFSLLRWSLLFQPPFSCTTCTEFTFAGCPTLKFFTDHTIYVSIHDSCNSQESSSELQQLCGSGQHEADLPPSQRCETMSRSRASNWTDASVSELSCPQNSRPWVKFLRRLVRPADPQN